MACPLLGVILGGFLDYGNRSQGNFRYDLPSTIGFVLGLLLSLYFMLRFLLTFGLIIILIGYLIYYDHLNMSSLRK
jgi:hypothetical protein